MTASINIHSAGVSFTARRCLLLASVLLLAAAMIMAQVPAAHAAAVWSPPENISPGDLYPYNEDPDMAVDADGNVHVVWEGDNGARQVFYASNAGGSWSEPLLISTNSLDSYGPQVALDPGDNPHVVWVGYDESNEDYRIWYSTNPGTGWQAPESISSTLSNCYGPQIAVDSGGNPHVAWYGYDDSYDHYRIWYSTNPGTGWEAPTLLSTAPCTDYQSGPQIAVDSGGNPHVVWHGHDTSYDYYRVWYATNPGTGWEAPTLISTSPCEHYQHNPQIAVDSGGNPHVVWHGHDTSYDYYRVWYATNPGTGWVTPKNISTSPCEHYQYSPQIAVDSGGNPHVAWHGYDTSDDYYRIWYATDPGTGWEAPTLLSTSPCAYYQNEPQIALDGGGYSHVVWGGDDAKGINRIWYVTNAEYSVTAAVEGGGGSVSPATQQVAHGGTATIDITPEDGYRIGGITDNGAPAQVADPYVITDVRQDHDVVVTFIPVLADWYLAEGSTDGGMETWVLVQNPNDEPVLVDLTLMTGTGPQIPAELQKVAIPADSRISFNLGAFVTTYDVSTMVNSYGGDVVCERAVYGGERTWGTDSIGVTAAAPVWYLAEGSTAGGMETYLLVQNPGASPVEIDVTFMTGSGAVAGPQGQVVGGGSRLTLLANDYVSDYEVSAMITSSGGDIVCERAMYGNSRTWGTDSIGATAPAPAWYLAEGCTAGGFETWVLVQNPNGSTASVDLTLMTESGPLSPPQLQGVPVPPGSRVSFNLGDYVTTYDVSAMVASQGGDVICERAMYGGDHTWGTCSIGATAPAPVWYLAEGCTEGGMETWVLVQNPGDAPVLVDLTYMTPTGAVPGPQDFAVPPRTRVSFPVADHVIDYHVSTMVTSQGGDVICERAMYGGGRTWAHVSIGHAPQ